MSEENSVVQTCIHLNVLRRLKLRRLPKGPPTHEQNQTEEFSAQRVIFILLWTTAADLQPSLSQQPVQD